MKYTKILMFVLGIAIAAGSLFMAGCHDKTKDLDKCLAFAKTTGMTVGYVINVSAGQLGPECIDTVAAITAAIATELPSNVTVKTIADDLRDISTNTVYTVFPGFYEKYPQFVDETIDALLGFLQIGLTSISDKYPTEFGNARMFYQIAYEFFSSVNSVISKAITTKQSDDIGPAFMILPVHYDDILNCADKNGEKILSEEDFEKLMSPLKD